MNFIEQLQQASKRNNSLLCVGLDPDSARFPECVRQHQTPIFTFNKAIIDATHDLVCAYKPQIAYYAGNGAESELQMTIDYIHKVSDVPVILDAKRGDIGSTAEQYAREVFERYRADAVTINPFLGFDSIEPFIEYRDKGIILLCRTSNPGGSDLQDLVLESGKTLYEHIAWLAATKWNRLGNLALVVGATRPDELRRIRELTGTMPFLVPGIGAQGGDIAATMDSGRGGLLIINSARAILYSGSDENFASAARSAALATRDEINCHR